MTNQCPRPSAVREETTRAMGISHTPRVIGRGKTRMVLVLLISVALHGLAALLPPPPRPRVRDQTQNAPLLVALIPRRPSHLDAASSGNRVAGPIADPSSLNPESLVPPHGIKPPAHLPVPDPLLAQRPPNWTEDKVAHPEPRPMALPRRQSRRPSAKAHQVHAENRENSRLPPETAGHQELASRHTLPPTEEGLGSQVDLVYPDARAENERAYLQALAAAIARQQRYPEEARRLEQTGTVVLGLTIQVDGRFSAIQLIQGSGHTLLDQAALTALNRLGRFKPIPPALARSTWSIQVPIRFRLD